MNTYPNGGTIVAAIGPTAGLSEAGRQELRARGAEFADVLQEEVRQASQAAGAGAGTDLVRDLARGRAASQVTIGAAFVALARSPKLSTVRLRRLFLRLLAWVEGQRADEQLTFAEAYRLEAREQAEADVALADLALAWERRDPTAMRRALDEIADHIGSLMSLQAVVDRAVRAIELGPPRPRARVVTVAARAGVLA